MFTSATRRLSAEMAAATTYAEWKTAAIAHDKESGVSGWQNSDESKHFDYESIRRRLKRLRRLKAKNDYAGVLFALNEGIHGNIDGMGNSALYGKAKFSTKKLIVEYVDEVASALDLLASSKARGIPLDDRLDFFRRARHCYGASSLMMSGAGSLLFFHIGVVKALWLEGVLPDILSGSSGGAVVGALVSTRSDKEIEKVFEPENLVQEIRRDQGLFERFEMFRPEVTPIEDVQEALNRLIPDVTFQEAFECTGRHLNVSIAAAEKHQTSRLLNAITTPNVYVREAVMASAAVPGFYPPVALAAKNDAGKKQPYLPSRRWVDGSLSHDLPAKRLSRIYGVNHFVVSQVNPHIFPFVTDTKRKKDALTTVKHAVGRTAREWVNTSASLLEKPLAWNATINRFTNIGLSIINQDYFGDINILPDRRLFNPLKLLAHRSIDEVVELIEMGEKATWPKIEMIRIQTKISKKLDHILTELDHHEPHVRSGSSRRAG
jgi:NTE family protein